MTANTSGIDRIVRVVLGIGLIALALFYMAGLGTLWTVVIAIVGLVLLGTAFASWCPIYAMFGLSTRNKD